MIKVPYLVLNDFKDWTKILIALVRSSKTGFGIGGFQLSPENEQPIRFQSTMQQRRASSE